MHEFSIAAGIMANMLEFVATHPNVTIRKIRLFVGELTCVDLEQLKFCYTSITQDTPLEGSELEIEPLPAAVECGSCAYRGAPKYWDGSLSNDSIPTLQCPKCGGAARATAGHECEIKSVQVFEQEEPAGAPG